MTFKEKRRAKKLNKVYTTLAYVMLILFILPFVFLFAGKLNHETANPIVAISLFIVPMCFALILAGIGQGYGMSRADYKNRIRLYREYRHFNIILDWLAEGKIQESLNLLNTIPTGNLRVFTNGYMLAHRMQSTDAEIKRMAEERLNQLREDFCHHNVSLDIKTKQKFL